MKTISVIIFAGVCILFACLLEEASAGEKGGDMLVMNGGGGMGGGSGGGMILKTGKKGKGTTLVMNNGHSGCHCPGYKKKYYMPVYKKEDHYEGTLDDGEYGHEEEESY